MDTVSLLLILLLLIMVGASLGNRASTSDSRAAEIREGRFMQKCGAAMQMTPLMILGISLVVPKGSIPDPTLGFLFLGSFALVYLGRKMKMEGKRAAAPKAEELWPGIIDESVSETESKVPINGVHPVLYFRSFDSDEEVTREVWEQGGEGTGAYIGRSEEQMIDSAFKQIGPMIAVGKPNQEFPTLGVARVLVPDEKWQARVVAWMEQAALVIVRAGISTGLMWELEAIKTAVDPKRVILLIPYRKKKYDEFRRKTGQIFTYGLPEYRRNFLTRNDINGLVYFDSQWKGTFVPLGGNLWTYYTAGELNKCLNIASSPVIRRLGLMYKPPLLIAMGIRRLIFALFAAAWIFMTVATGGILIIVTMIMLGVGAWMDGLYEEWESWQPYETFLKENSRL
jgi:hypothetical protein